MNFFLIFKNYLFIYLVGLSLSCSLQSHSCSLWDPVPLPGIEPRPPALGVQSHSHPRRCRWMFFKALTCVAALSSCKVITSSHSSYPLVMDLPRELLPRMCPSCRSSLTVIHSVVQYYKNFSDIRPFQYKVFFKHFCFALFQNKHVPQAKGISSLFIKLPLEGLRFPGQLSDCGPFADRNIQGICDKLQQLSVITFLSLD